MIKKYFFKRILYMIPMMLGISFISFMIIQMAPGDSLSTASLDPHISPEVIKQMRQEFGLDKPVIVQYGLWLKNIFCLNFGYSFSYRVPVSFLILNRLGNTLVLAFFSLFLGWLLVIPLGLISALYKDKFIDRSILIGSSIAIGLPSFFLALIFLFIAAKTQIFPIGGMTSLDIYGMNFFQKMFDILRHAFLPALVLALLMAGPLIRILRNTSLDILNAPYILYGRARRLSEKRILIVHVLRNAFNPLITILGYQFSALLSGAAFVEIIFSWPGIGRLMLDAVLSRDIYLIMANLFISAILLLLGNLLADILLMSLDKRIKI